MASPCSSAPSSSARSNLPRTQDLASSRYLEQPDMVQLHSVHIYWHLRLLGELLDGRRGGAELTSLTGQTPYYFLTAYTTLKVPSLDPTSILHAIPLTVANFACGFGRVSSRLSPFARRAHADACRRHLPDLRRSRIRPDRTYQQHVLEFLHRRRAPARLVAVCSDLPEHSGVRDPRGALRLVVHGELHV